MMNMNHYEALENVTMFLLRETGSIWGTWHGRMNAKEQRKLFGKFLGKGKIYIDGYNERIDHTVKVCFGTDFQVTAEYNLKNGKLIKD